MSQSNVSDAQCYGIFKGDKLLSILSNNNISISHYNIQLNTNRAFIYRLPSGELVMLPNSLKKSDSGILFKNEECFNEFYQKDKFPIENSEMSVHERYQNEIIGFKNNIFTNINYFSGFISSKIDSAMDRTTLSELLSQIREKRDNLDDKGRLLAALLLGEYIRQLYNGEWYLMKHYGDFNPYYEPILMYPNGSIFLLLDDAHTYFENSNLPLEKFANWDEVKYPINTVENTFAFEFKKM